MVKLAKKDRLDTLILLARDGQVLFSPCKCSKGGTIGRFGHIFLLDETYVVLVFHLFLTDSPLNMIISHLEIKVFAYLEASRVHSRVLSYEY